MDIRLIGIGLYLIVLIILGVLASRRMHDVKDYFAAGKNLNFLAVAFSARATGESAWLLLGLTGMGAAVGVHAFWVVLGEILGVAVAWLFMARRFNNLGNTYDAITVPDYLEGRFRDASHLIRLVAATALTVFVTIYVSAQIDATGKAFETFLGWNYFSGALFGFGIVIVYIAGGGFLAVVWSDVFQGAMMFLGLVTLPIIGLVLAGGWAPVAEGLRAQDPGLLSIWGPDGYSLNTLLATISLFLIGIGFLGSPQIFVRFIALRSPDEVKRGATVAIVWTVLAGSGAVLTGMVGRHLLMGAGDDLVGVLGTGGENVLPHLVEHALPLFLVGIFMAIVLAAIMSTADSLLVVASSAFVRDYYQKVRRPDLPDDALVTFSRVTTVVLALVALSIAMLVAWWSPTRTIFWFVIFGWSGIAATFCPTIILSLFWRGITSKGALAAMITGFACVPFFKFVGPEIPGLGPHLAALGELPTSFAMSFIAGVTVSLFDAKGRAKLAGVEKELAAAR